MQGRGEKPVPKAKKGSPPVPPKTLQSPQLDALETMQQQMQILQQKYDLLLQQVPPAAPQPPEQLPAASAAVTPKPEAAKPLEPPAALQPPAPKASAPAPPQPLEEPNPQVSEGEIAKVFDLDNKATWHSRSCFFPLLFNFSFPSLLLSFPFASLSRREFLKQE